MARYKRDDVNMVEFSEKLKDLHDIAVQVTQAARGQQGKAFPDDLSVEGIKDYVRLCLLVARETSDAALMLNGLEERMRREMAIRALEKKVAKSED